MVGVRLSKELMAVAGEALKVNVTTLGPLVLPLSEQVGEGRSVGEGRAGWRRGEVKGKVWVKGAVWTGMTLAGEAAQGQHHNAGAAGAAPVEQVGEGSSVGEGRGVVRVLLWAKEVPGETREALKVSVTTLGLLVLPLLSR